MSLNGTRILVTGGAGFIGSHLVRDLLTAGARVTVLDDLTSGYRENLCDVIDDIRFVEGTILDADALNAVVKGQEIVSHQAAQLEILRAMDDPGEDLITNTLGTLRVLQACVRHGVRRFIAPSSAGVYGQAKVLPQTEDHPFEPQWAYGVSKLACEHYARIFAHDHGLQTTMLRYAIVYGPREWYGRVLTLFLRRLIDGQPPVIFGDGQQIRDFVYVEDVVAFHRACLLSEATHGEVYNVSTGVGTTVAELAEVTARVAETELGPIYETLSEGQTSAHIPGRKRIPSELRALVQCPKKAEAATGWRPAVSLEEGIRRQWEWLQANPERYQPEVMRV